MLAIAHLYWYRMTACPCPCAFCRSNSSEHVLVTGENCECTEAFPLPRQVTGWRALPRRDRYRWQRTLGKTKVTIAGALTVSAELTLQVLS